MRNVAQRPVGICPIVIKVHDLGSNVDGGNSLAIGPVVSPVFKPVMSELSELSDRITPLYNCGLRAGISGVVICPKVQAFGPFIEPERKGRQYSATTKTTPVANITIIGSVCLENRQAWVVWIADRLNGRVDRVESVGVSRREGCVECTRVWCNHREERTESRIAGNDTAEATTVAMPNGPDTSAINAERILHVGHQLGEEGDIIDIGVGASRCAPFWVRCKAVVIAVDIDSDCIRIQARVVESSLVLDCGHRSAESVKSKDNRRGFIGVVKLRNMHQVLSRKAIGCNHSELHTWSVGDKTTRQCFSTATTCGCDRSSIIRIGWNVSDERCQDAGAGGFDAGETGLVVASAASIGGSLASGVIVTLLHTILDASCGSLICRAWISIASAIH